MDRFLRFGLIAAVAALALLIPTRAASDTPPPVIEIELSLTDLPAPVVNVRVPEQAAPVIEFPELPAPVVNVDIPEGFGEPPTIIVEPSPVLPPEVVYRDVEVEVERIVEVERVVLCDAFNSTDRAFAFIDNGLVTNVAGGSGAEFQSYLNAVAGQGREVTCVVPRPGIGWTFDGEEFAPPE
ncbi:MAG TPA: hypothetical protein VIG24_10295 [Acidimicrobiia bacterium]